MTVRSDLEVARAAVRTHVISWLGRAEARKRLTAARTEMAGLLAGDPMGGAGHVAAFTSDVRGVLVYLGTWWTMDRGGDRPLMTLDIEVHRRGVRELVRRVMGELVDLGARDHPVDRTAVAQLLMTEIPLTDSPGDIFDQLFVVIPERGASDEIVGGAGLQALHRLRRDDQRRRGVSPRTATYPAHRQPRARVKMRREEIRRSMALPNPPTPKQLAQQHGVSVSTISRDLQLLR